MIQEGEGEKEREKKETEHSGSLNNTEKGKWMEIITGEENNDWKGTKKNRNPIYT